MRRRKAHTLALHLGLVALAAALACGRALAGATVVETGARIHGGEQGKGFQGVMGYFLYIQAGRGKGYVRPNCGVQLGFLSGEASIGAETASATLYSAHVMPGIDFYFAKGGRVRPFLDVHAALGWHSMQADVTSTANLPYKSTIGYTYGGFMGAGADFKFGRLSEDSIGAATAAPSETTVRLHSTYSMILGKLAGVAGFQLGAFSLSIGLSF